MYVRHSSLLSSFKDYIDKSTHYYSTIFYKTMYYYLSFSQQWNAPILLFCMKMAPAIALGNVVIIKPAEQTPLTSLALAALVVEVISIRMN